MPRVTRRSVASKEETTPKESPKSAGRRGTKKEEPAAEDVTPQGTPSKRGGRQAAAKEVKSEAASKRKSAARGRSTSRGGRGKKVEEPENEEEGAAESEHEEEDQEQSNSAQSKGKGRASRGKKSGGTQNTGRSGRGAKAAEEEEKDVEVEESVENEDVKEAEAAEVPARGRDRSRSKAAPVTPSPQIGRRGRGKGAASEEKNEEKKEEDVEEESKAVENEVETTPKGRQRQTPNKEAKPAASSAGRRARGQKAEPSPKTPPASGRSTRRAGGTAASTEEVTAEKDEEAAAAEPMETGEEQAEPSKTEAEPEKEQASVSVEKMVTEESSESVSPPKKRKQEEDDDVDSQHAAKRAKTSEEPPPEAKAELEDFVIVSKDDVPLPDSKEVTDSLPPAVVSAPTTPDDDTSPESPRINPLAAATDVTFVVPLTEAELAKQYSSQQSDKDETSSTLVEVGSECASDVTMLSSRGLDISDAITLDSTDQGHEEDAMDVAKEPSSPSPGPQATSAEETAPQRANADPSAEETAPQQTNADPSAEETAPQQANADPSAEETAPQQANADPSAEETSPQQANADPSEDQPVSSQHNSSNAAPADSQTSLAASPAPNVNSNTSQPAQCSPGVLEVHAGSASLETARSDASSPCPQPPSQNGTVEELELPNSDHQASSSPGKPLSVVAETYVPSSTAIDKRKFISNQAFPIDLMDPAFCFSIVSYNILADCHLRRSDYSYTQSKFLEQVYRHELMLKELDYLDGDIICLQEVNPTYYINTLLPAMKSRGFDGHFIKRTKDYWDEGEATFVRTSRFDVVSNQSASLRDLAFKEVDDSGVNEEVSRAAKKHLDRADVILLTELQCKKTSRIVTICNIHVVYDLKAPDVQCIQVACAVKQLVAKAGSDMNPHIICGDFNSDVVSPCYQLAKDGYLSDDHIHKLQNLENLDNTDGSSRSLINHMWRAFQHTSSNLKSAYELTLGKEPPVTSFTKNTHKTLDYIFHSAGSVDTVGVLETLDLQVVDATGGLPSASIPSDHLSLKAVFRLKE